MVGSGFRTDPTEGTLQVRGERASGTVWGVGGGCYHSAMSETELSDLAALEWVRVQKTRLAPESTDAVRALLKTSASAREKVAAMERLERLMHPYGSPAPVDPRPKRARVALKIASAFLLVGLALAAFLLFR